ncbi:MAG: hypothetical protein IT289_04685 [Oligoflexia bacterium]|nr:hypothetical protein [Oligoflexia bacterium]
MGATSPKSDKPLWVDNFKIDQPTWESLVNQANREGRSPLSVALDLGLLNENKLNSWDREKSGLASLKTFFFNGQPPQDLWKQFDRSWCQKNSCLPIGTWEDVTYFAKLSSEEIPLPQNATKVVWVLAPWTGIKKWLSQWTTTQESTPPSEASAVPPAKSAEIEMPDGLKIDTVSTSFSVPSPTAPAAPAFEAPAGLSLDGLDNLEKTAAAPEGLGFELDLEPTKVTPDPESERPSVPQAPIQININLGQANAGADSAKIPMDKANSLMNEAASQDDLAKTFMGLWHNFFDKVMILLFQDGKLYTWRWSGPWVSGLNPGDEIPLNTPSIFKIVADTASSYHGYVAPGPVNDEFFNKTSAGQYPEHVTITPVIAQDSVMAMCIGICSKANGQGLVLGRLEEQTQLFAKNLTRILASIRKTG